jgi:hypothetical protein
LFDQRLERPAVEVVVGEPPLEIVLVDCEPAQQAPALLGRRLTGL